MKFGEVVPALKDGKFVYRKCRNWAYTAEKIRLENDTLKKYDKQGYLFDAILYRQDLEAEDWEIEKEE